MLADAGLELVGTHVGGNLDDQDQAEGEITIIDAVLDYVESAGTTRIAYSGLRYESDDQFARDLEMLSRSAEKCRERGAALLYHNHWWEFDRDWRTIRGLLDQGSEAIGFCPDVGWVHKASADVIAFLGQIRGRVGAVHYKDFLSQDADARDFCTLGEGVTPFDNVTEWLRATCPDVWVIAEQDSSELPAAEAVQRNADYLKRTVLG